MSESSPYPEWPGCDSPRILLALDCDGGLTETVPRPADAGPDRELLRLLEEFGAKPGLAAARTLLRDLQESRRAKRTRTHA